MTPHRSLGPGDVAAPASDALLFRHSILRGFVVFVAVTLVAWALSMVLTPALLGHPAGWNVLGSSTPLLLGGAAGFSMGARRHRRHPTWVRVSSLGIELANQGDPVFVPWSNMTATRVRRWWIFAVLEVIPTDLDAVDTVHPGRYLPKIRYRRGVALFRVEVGLIRPGLRDLRAALAQYRQLPERALCEPTGLMKDMYGFHR